MAVAAARAETVNRLAGALNAARDQAPAFALPEIALDGWMEKMLPEHSALEIEDRYRELLKENRARDVAAGRTLSKACRSTGQQRGKSSASGSR